MKKYTQSDFDNFEVDENGYKICPSGDYTQISSFGEGCSFGARCSFGEERVKEVHAGTIHEKTYFAACDFAELMLKAGAFGSARPKGVIK